jgi:hypothetical protein
MALLSAVPVLAKNVQHDQAGDNQKGKPATDGVADSVSRTGCIDEGIDLQ